MMAQSGGSSGMVASSLDDGATWTYRRENSPGGFGITKGPLGQLCVVGTSGVIFTGLTAAVS